MGESVSVDELLDYMEDQIISIKKTNKSIGDVIAISDDAHKCKECGSKTQIDPVNVSRDTMIGGEYRSVIYCIKDIECGFHKFSKKRAIDLRRKRVDRIREIGKKINIETEGVSIIGVSMDRKLHERSMSREEIDEIRSKKAKSGCGSCGQGK